jgi:transposase
VRLYKEDGLTYAEIAKRLGICKAVWIKRWCSAYRQEGVSAFQKSSGRPHKGQNKQDTLEPLRMENALLNKFHTGLRTAMLARRNIGSLSTTGSSTR